MSTETVHPRPENPNLNLDALERWIHGADLAPQTKRSYRNFLRRLFQNMGITPDRALELAKSDSVGFWNQAKAAASDFTPAGRTICLMGLKRLMRDNGIYPPADRLKYPRRKAIPASLSWNQGLAIVGAASRPYNYAFRLMLHCGWGLSEFLTFNTADTWDAVRGGLTSNPNAEYYKFDFPGRKLNGQPFYSVVPVKVLREIIQSGIPLPIATLHGPDKGRPLNLDNYESNSTYLHRAFRTAVNRAPIKVSGRLTLHELRDTFYTQLERLGVPYEIREFALGHLIDARGYSKLWGEPEAIWREVKKLFEGEVSAEIQADMDKRDMRIADLMAKNEQLEAEVKRSKAMLGTVLQRMESLDKSTRGLEALVGRLPKKPRRAKKT
jgi:integrase